MSNEKATLEVTECTTLGIESLSHQCHVEIHWIVMLVEHDILQPLGSEQQNWEFNHIQQQRACRAARLTRDFELDLHGLDVTLNLLDRIDRLEQELKLIRLQVDPII